MKKQYRIPITETVKINPYALLDIAYSNPEEGNGWEGDAKRGFDDSDMEEIEYNIWKE